MIVTRKIALRIALVVLATVILQVSFFSQLTILGAAPTIIPVVVVSLGLLGGGVLGAVAGFATGFLLDSVLLQTLGASSLVLLLIGYLAGRYREGFPIASKLVPPLLAGGFTLLAAAGFAVLQLMLGVDTAVSLLVVREIIVQSLLAVLLGFGLYPLVRRVLAPALIDYTPSRRSLLPGFARRRRARRIARRPTTATALAPAAHGTRVRRGRGRRRRAPVGGGIA